MRSFWPDEFVSTFTPTVVQGPPVGLWALSLLMVMLVADAKTVKKTRILI